MGFGNIKLFSSEPIVWWKRQDGTSVLILYARSYVISEKSEINLLNVCTPFNWQSDAFERVTVTHVDVS
jgi:hypothetical protein